MMFKKIKKYRFAFDKWGFILFMAIMLPNFLWMVFPTSNDILRTPSNTPFTDMLASVFQVVLIFSVSFVKNKEYKPPINIQDKITIITCVILYYLLWILYFVGYNNFFIILGLAVFPCVAFIDFAFAKKNYPAKISAIGFAFCHLTFAIMNFLI